MLKDFVYCQLCTFLLSFNSRVGRAMGSAGLSVNSPWRSEAVLWLAWQGPLCQAARAGRWEAPVATMGGWRALPVVSTG